MQSVIEKALAKRRGDRYTSVGRFIGAFREAIITYEAEKRDIQHKEEIKELQRKESYKDKVHKEEIEELQRNVENLTDRLVQENNALEAEQKENAKMLASINAQKITISNRETRIHSLHNILNEILITRQVILGFLILFMILFLFIPIGSQLLRAFLILLLSVFLIALMIRPSRIWLLKHGDLLKNWLISKVGL